MNRLFISILLTHAAAMSFTGCVNASNRQLSDYSAENRASDTSFVLNVFEPSGLALLTSGDALYVVSDKNGSVYRIDFTGNVLERLPFKGKDLEGIDVDKTTGEIWIVEESKQNIHHLSKDGNEIDKITAVHLDTKKGSGFEGIAKNGDTLYILIEKDPGLLIKYCLSSKTWKDYPLSFAKDYSGIDYDTSDNSLWIVSDESKSLNHCDLNGRVISTQKIKVLQAEGVVVDRKGKCVWIVSDKAHTLYRIRLKI
ncbi:MAG TPA: SdiA-regulated domain-containing protein [Bacteroidales bacterium]|nr:SdiA-regulated domain-containing protein [Bacteroidales bacterium]